PMSAGLGRIFNAKVLSLKGADLEVMEASQNASELQVRMRVTKASRDDLSTPYYVQRLWPARESSVAIVSGQEARLIEAEAQLRAGNTAASLTTLNALRATFAGMTPLTDAGTEASRVDQLFRERAFTLFGRGTRTGDMRRLKRTIRMRVRACASIGTRNLGGRVCLRLGQFWWLA
ncbi:MAG: RagB/SusD family nutrient uptake outer membrane protein, partial [Pseudomonadota bacterium]